MPPRIAPRIAIAPGDPAGVGPELIQQALSVLDTSGARLTVLGNRAWLDRLRREQRGIETYLEIGDKDFEAEPGKPEPKGAKFALACMQAAADGCSRGEYDGVVTGPISKERCAEVGLVHPGQTEFFAAHWGGEPTMAFVSDRLRLALATWHIPLREVATALNAERLQRAVRRARSLAVRMGVADPRIGVCGLNPHAGEGGLLGREEKEALDPALDALRGEIPRLSRCLPGDTVFHRALRGEFDVVVALYHDQGLAPLKALDFDGAVNVTLGLPFTRTSPDHGTAYPLAGTGTASPRSFENAIRLAVQLARQGSLPGTRHPLDLSGDVSIME